MRISPRVWVLVAFVAVRIVALTQALDSPAVVLHEWPASDMSNFHRWATAIGEGDLLTSKTLWNQSNLNRAAAAAWLARHPEDPLNARPLDEASEVIWNRWYRAPHFYGEPLYPYVLAAWRVVFGPSGPAGLLLQLILAAAGLWLMMLVMARAFGEKVSLVAGVMTTLCGPLAYLDLHLLRDTLTTTLCWALLWRVDVARERSSVRAWAIAGAVGALTLLGRMTAAPLLLVAFLVGVRTAPPERRRHVVIGWLVGFTIAFSPVVARNIVVGAPPFSLAGNGAFAFYTANYHGADPWRGLMFDPVDTARIYDEANNSQLAVAVATLRTHPDAASFFALQARKLSAFFHAHEIPDNTSFDLMSRHVPILRLLPLGFGVALLLGAIGAAIAVRRRHGLLVVTLAGILALLPLLLQPISRYRMSMVAVLIALSAVALVAAFDAWRSGAGRNAGRRNVVIGAVVFAAGLALLHRPLHVPRTRAVDHLVTWRIWALPRAQVDLATGGADAPALVAGTMRLFRRGEPLAAELDDPAVTGLYNAARVYEADPAKLLAP